MKGCNLRCRWCHNPETFSSLPEIEWIQDKCISCGVCIDVCQPKAIYIQEEKIKFNKGICTACFACISKCFPEAIRKIGRKVTPNEVFSEIEPDFSFFKESKGGITISGGEPILQAEFVRETFLLFHKAGIHTALETNLSLSWEKYQAVLPYVDLIMADLKLVEENSHIKWTGSTNKQIKENILKLDQSNRPYILRTPVVPDVNDSEESLQQIIHFISELKNMLEFELLPFHPLAATKYKNLGISNSFQGMSSISTDKLKQYKHLLKQLKFNTGHYGFKPNI